MRHLDSEIRETFAFVDLLFDFSITLFTKKAVR